jgi:uncharacterized membrane protein
MKAQIGRQHIDALALIGLASSISLLSGWRLYLCLFATGLAMRAGWIALPEHLHGLAVLANPWVIGVAAAGLIAEFFADKIVWLDSLWDGVHTLVRPVGGAFSPWRSWTPRTRHGRL